MQDHNKHKIVFRLSALGDLVLTTGVMAYWAEKFGYTFTVITKAQYASVLENTPHISNVIELEKEDLGDLAWFNKAGELACEFEGCELIDLHSTLRSMILASRWKGPVSRYQKFSLERRLFKLTRSDRLEQKLSSRRVTARYASALEDTPPAAEELLPRIYLSAEELEAARNLLAEHDLEKGFVALHPYATHPDKAWPREHWTSLISLLYANGIRWAIIGRDDDIFDGGPEECNFTNQLTLRETCALLNFADRLVTGDSGPMHLAAGVGTPVVAMFGPTSEAWGFYPAGPHDEVLEYDLKCRPCSLHGKSNCKKDRECLRTIMPDHVLEKLREPVE